MAATKEGKVKTQVKRLLDNYGVYHFSPQSGIYGRAGIPDIIACYNGRFLAIECKAGGGKTTALQDKELEKIREAGGTAIVINEHNVADLQTHIIMTGV